MRYTAICILVVLLGCGANPLPTDGGGQPIVEPKPIALGEARFLVGYFRWHITDTVTGEGTFIYTMMDGRDTIAHWTRGTLTNLHDCTASGVATSVRAKILEVFDDMEIPDTSSNCIESEW